MKTMKMTIAGAALSMALMAGAGMTALAAEPDTDMKASYGYLAGQQKNVDRHAQFEEIEGLSDDAEREAYFESHGIGAGSAYSSEQHLDLEKLMGAGIIDQETADRIAEAASKKHQDFHSGFAGRDSMTQEERQAFYEGLKSEGRGGDTVDALLNAGIITEEQAEAINGYLSAQQ